MRKYISFLFLFLLTFSLLSSCKTPEPLQYNVNKTPELKQYESELQAESLYKESLAQESLLAKEKAEEEEKAKEALIWKKKDIQKDRVKVKGIYITDLTAGSPKMEDILSKMKDTELNALVIDIKNDNGQIVYQMNNGGQQEFYNTTNIVKDLPALLKKCHEQGLYLIARLVCFRDPAMGEVHPEWMNQKADGSLFKDNSGMTWINPYKKDYWDYIASVAERCADDGFDEIQLDYVRFCTEKGMKEVQYPEEAETNKTQIITEFVQYMSDRLANKQVFFFYGCFWNHYRFLCGQYCCWTGLFGYGCFRGLYVSYDLSLSLWRRKFRYRTSGYGSLQNDLLCFKVISEGTGFGEKRRQPSGNGSSLATGLYSILSTALYSL